MIDRRTALAGVAAMFGAGLYAPLARAMSGETGLSLGANASAAVFNAAQRALVAALSERVIPTTDTPGAIAADVPAYIEKLLAEWAFPDDLHQFIAGLGQIDLRSHDDYKIAGARATSTQLDALLTVAMNDQLPGGQVFFNHMRQLVIAGYYTSEIGIMQEREYLPVPGRYDGAYLYSNVKKIFSS